MRLDELLERFRPTALKEGTNPLVIWSGTFQSKIAVRYWNGNSGLSYTDRDVAYFETTSDGRVVNLQPTNDARVSDWTALQAAYKEG